MQIELRQISRAARDHGDLRDARPGGGGHHVRPHRGHAPGEIEQDAAPDELYEAPRTVFVLDFVGKSSRLEGTVVEPAGSGSVVRTALGDVTVRHGFVRGSPVWVGVRADRLAVVPPDGEARGEGINRLPHVPLRDVISHGSTRLLILEGGPQDRLNVQVLGARGGSYKVGEVCGLEFRLDDTLCYPREVAA